MTHMEWALSESPSPEGPLHSPDANKTPMISPEKRELVFIRMLPTADL